MKTFVFYGLACVLVLFFIHPNGCQEVPSAEPCVDGTIWNDNCAKCTCIEDQENCSLTDCKSEITESDVSDIDCKFTTIGAGWKKNCNWCHCHQTDGFSMCTRRACPPISDVHLRDSDQCKLDANWKKDPCNWCDCVNNRTICSNNTCITTIAQKARLAVRIHRLKHGALTAEECKVTSEGSRWKRACNWCRCSPRSLSGVCTRRRCHPRYSELSRGKPDCEGDASWMKNNCNWCTCVNGTGVCTEKACITQDPREPETHDNVSKIVVQIPNEKEKTCETDESNPGRWRSDCNWCHCSKGMSACTLIGCIATNRTRNTDVCEGSVSWKKDCNWCECINDRAACTDKLCGPIDVVTSTTEAPAIEEGACTRETSWVENCNTCYCVEGRALCTVRACIATSETSFLVESPSADIQTLVDKMVSLDSKTCKDGSRWRVRCNWCTCSDKGQASCTIMGCLPGYPNDGPQCEDGSEWKIDCNSCMCVNSLAVCTEKKCDSTEKNESTFKSSAAILPAVSGINVKSSASEVSCVEGSRWKNKCNWCNCNGGVGVCTILGCLGGSEDQDGTCIGESKWKRGCNWCNCVNGRGVCTQIFCLAVAEQGSSISEISGISSTGAVADVKSSDSEVSCVEGSRWKNKCNWCNCNGGVGVCTILGCLGGSEDQDGTCIGESKWKKGCNWCNCVNGRGVCTQILCLAEKGSSTNRETVISPTEAEDNAKSQADEKSCTDGSRWMNKCNWCSCNGGIGVCTLMGCLTGSEDLDGTCKGESKWKKKCNWCHCINGRGVCTQMHCLTEKESTNSRSAAISHTGIEVNVKSSTSEVSCLEGSRWMNKCNWCSCNGGIGVCTLMGCLTGSEDLDGTCIGESRWKQDCNWCHCVNGRGVCTQILCLKESDIIQFPAQDPPIVPPVKKERCVSGSSWADHCNTCICINNIKVCTKKACNNAVVKSEPCIAEESWKQECNSCQCINGEAACTRRRCKAIARTTPAKCLLPAIDPDASHCGGFESKWTYVSDESICQEIIYGGCGGTENLFATEEECLITCGGQPTMASQPISVEEHSREHCKLPVDVGECNALMARYAFIPEKNRCEEFIYGGCLGNQNNFLTAEACLDSCGGEPPVIDSNCDRSKCDWKRYAHYFVKKCNPVYQGGSCCPTKFECNEKMPESSVKCFYKDVEYNAGEKVPVGHSCSRGCICRQGFGERPAHIICADVECPSLFRRPSPNCRQIYAEDRCCSVTEECSDPNSPADTEVRTQGCEWNGKTFRLGDRMYFDDFPCQRCVCTPNFLDPKGPGCSKISCGFEFRYREKIAKGCTPLYFENKCCPIDWLCPGSKILSSPPLDALPQTTPMRSALCVAGNLTVPVGSTIPVRDCHLRCSCVTPPDITCIRFRSCDMAETGLKPQKSEAKCSSQAHPCMNDCIIELEPSSGCPTCICSAVEFRCREPQCPSNCLNSTTSFDEEIGCPSCQCKCQDTPQCPKNCVVRFIKDPKTGCDICECDPTDAFNQATK